ncbi:MAG: metal-dependent hydrolase [Deltaproteobacteria bacterium]|nr:metal-dependent hydrolase [Deltaproteobacteria bacterium]
MIFNTIIDSHLHTGVQNVSWPWEDIRPLHRAAGISGAGVIAPVEDVYNRYNPAFVDDPEWQACRRRAHRYLLDLVDPDITFYRYFFVWNDFAWEDLGPEFVAVKWHRHPDEPRYQYDDPRCREFLEVVRARRLPILLEESLANTLFFLDELVPPQVPVVIPHLGGLSGGYRALARAGVWERPQVWADTALADIREMHDYLNRCGPERLMFGSDYPFGLPRRELDKVLSLKLPPEAAQAILAGNFLRLIGKG